MVNGRRLGGEPRGHAAGKTNWISLGGKTNPIRLVGKTKPNRMKSFLFAPGHGPGAHHPMKELVNA